MAKPYLSKLKKRKKLEPLFDDLDFSSVETVVYVLQGYNKYFYLIRGYNCQLIKKERIGEAPSFPLDIDGLDITNTLDLLSYRFTNRYSVFMKDLHKTYTEFFIDNL